MIKPAMFSETDFSHWNKCSMNYNGYFMLFQNNQNYDIYHYCVHRWSAYEWGVSFNCPCCVITYGIYL